MDITGKIPSIVPLTHARNNDSLQNAVETHPSRSPDTGDPVSLSPQVRELQTARAAVEAMPDIREEKVAAIRAQLEAGTYVVDSEKIASKMVAEALINTLHK